MQRVVTPSACYRCPGVCHRRVIGRGAVPADLLLIGEAPGKSEEVLRKPFVGRSGRLLDSAIAHAGGLAGYVPSYYITNCLQCRPHTDDGSNRPPTNEELWACLPNLLKVVKRIHPKRILLIGAVARDFLRQTFPDADHIVHPSFVLRTGGMGSPEYVRIVAGLETIFNQMKEQKR